MKIILREMTKQDRKELIERKLNYLQVIKQDKVMDNSLKLLSKG